MKNITFCRFNLSLLLILFYSFGLAQMTTKKPIITEASGIYKNGYMLYIVCDNTIGEYYSYSLAGMNLGKITVLDDLNRIKKKPLHLGPIELDLEGIVLMNDEAFVTSERTRTLLSKERVVKNYSNELGEFGNRGIEGIAIDVVENTKVPFNIATLWEGGYPASEDIAIGIKNQTPINSMSPYVLINSFDGNKTFGPDRLIELNMTTVNKWVDKHYPNDKEPHANRYRAPDIVWHNGGFIVLLSSERTATTVDKIKYKSKLLQKFDINGQSVGEPFELKKFIGKDENLNWEGLAWYENGKSLILIDDNKSKNPRIAIIEIPKDWK